MATNLGQNVCIWVRLEEWRILQWVAHVAILLGNLLSPV